MEPRANWPQSHSNYHGQNSTSILQNDGMVSIPPNFGNTSALQQQQLNYSFNLILERSYCDSQKPIFLDSSSTHGRIDGGSSSFGAAQIGNCVDSFGRSLRDLDQTYAHLGGMNYFPMGTSQGNPQGMLQNTASPYPAVPTLYPSYTPTEQPSKVQPKSAKCGVTPHSNGVSGSSRYTGCESKCEYCGKNAPLVDYFLKRTVESFRDQHPKLCKKLDKLCWHLRKCTIRGVTAQSTSILLTVHLMVSSNFRFLKR
ncbi:uncharacterized protein LOC113277560 [Papaver somniferum]|uniref:uncharacterized protein LOC113277560 n=1 Tax=Papaver somniferum TaxID=3469 RepID=UPI000E6FCDAC|nr:uncharacterized protein LOC113277560 [Papaver somniferum]